MHLYHLPIARTDESLYSLVARTRRVNIFRCDHDACNAVLGSSRVSSIDGFPVSLDHFCASTSYAYGDAQAVLYAHTPAGYFQRMGRPPWHVSVRNLSPLHARFSLGLLSHGISRGWRVCPDCCQTEIGRWGSCYWHRAHQLPGTLVCPVHGTNLQSVYPRQNGIHAHFMLPDEVESCTPADTPNECAVHTQLCQIARINDDILNDKDEVLPHLAVQSTLYYELRQRGMLDRHGKVAKSMVVHGFSEHHHRLSKLLQFSDALSPGAVIRMASALARQSIISSLQLVLLIDYLFGSWAAFKERGRWESVLGFSLQTQAPGHGLSYLPDPAAKTYHRQICLSLLKEHPAATRSIFAKAAPKSFHWLFRHDEQWFDQTLPRHAKSMQLKFSF